MVLAKLRSKFLTKETWLYMASFLCLIHCLSLPFLAVLSPAIAHRLENEFFEYAVFVFFILCGLYVLMLGVCVHQKKKLWLLFMTGALLWLFHDGLSDLLGDVITFSYLKECIILIGSVFVLMAYVLNHRYLHIH